MIEQDGTELEYDSFDLTNISQRNGFQLPPPRKRENLNDFLSNLTMKVTIPKQDVRKMDLVSYRGPRSMVTVGMSVESRSISRSMYPPSIGRLSVE